MKLILEAVDINTINNISEKVKQLIKDWDLQLEEDISDIDDKDNPTLNYFLTTEENEKEGIFASRISPMFENIEDLNTWTEENKEKLEEALYDLYSSDNENIFTDWINKINE